MNRLMMRRLEGLRKRTEWLERRIAQHTGGPPLTYDAAELDALIQGVALDERAA